MSAILLDQALAYLRAQFTRAEVATLQSYGGEFSAAESDQLSYDCPAILVTVLGWQPEDSGTRLAGRFARQVRLAAFVAYKHANRDKRMAGAMALAEKLTLVLRLWQPDSAGVPVELGPVEATPTAENLYGRAMDKRGQALWLVSWSQCLKPRVPLAALVDLLAVEITDTTRQGTTPTGAPAAPAPLTVTEDVRFGSA